MPQYEDDCDRRLAIIWTAADIVSLAAGGPLSKVDGLSDRVFEDLATTYDYFPEHRDASRPEIERAEELAKTVSRSLFKGLMLFDGRELDLEAAAEERRKFRGEALAEI